MKLTENVLEIRNLMKDFPSVRAVNDVSFDIKRNTVHCLVGENGAGKSTLIKILTGAYARSGGRILLNGEEYNPHSPRDAKQKGISTLFQELNVVDQLTVEENLTLGMEDTTFGFPAQDRQDQQDGQRDEQPRALHQAAPAGLDPERGQEADRGDRQGGGHGVRHHHHGRADGGDLRRRDRPPVPDHQGPAREKRHRHLHLPPPGRDLRARGLRDGDARRQAHRHQAGGGGQGPLGADQDDDRQDGLRGSIRPSEGAVPGGRSCRSKPLQPQAERPFLRRAARGRSSVSTAWWAPARPSWPAPSTAWTSTRGRSCFKGRKLPALAGQGHRGGHRPGAGGKTIAGAVHHPDHPGQRAGHEHGQDLPRRLHQRGPGAEGHAGVHRQAADRHQQHRKGSRSSSPGATSRRWSSPSACSPTPIC